MALNILSVYGPVTSWRYGRSLGIDPIGSISTCSFNCVYCQLGEIERKTLKRSLFVDTEQIITDLEQFDHKSADIITLSGSGEPTLAMNLGEILSELDQITGKPTLVLTNGTLLNLPEVRKELNIASKVSVKLDGVDFEQVKRVDRPVEGINWDNLMEGIKMFSQEYSGELSIQTMVLSPWDNEMINKYIDIVSELAPYEIQLNLPHRPKPLVHQIDARGNHSDASSRVYQVIQLKCVGREVLEAIASRITKSTHIPVRLPKLL